MVTEAKLPYGLAVDRHCPNAIHIYCTCYDLPYILRDKIYGAVIVKQRNQQERTRQQRGKDGNTYATGVVNEIDAQSSRGVVWNDVIRRQGRNGARG